MPDIGPTDANLAFLYANGELDAEAKAAFERRLGEEQPLREALCQAVELMRTLEGLAPLVPPPAYRQRVRQRLQPTGGWWRGRTYGGHPVFWSGLGAAAALLAVFAFPPGWLPMRRPAPSVEPVAKEQSHSTEPETPREALAGLATIEMADRLAELKKNNPTEYQREIREVFQVAEILADLQDDPRRQDLELKVWKTENKVHALIAKLSTPKEEERKKVETGLREMARELVDLDIQVLELRADQLDKELGEVKDDLGKARGQMERNVKARHEALLDQAKKGKKG